ncbi:gamma-glutamylcyclotransferase [Methylobacterium sp. 17Sr1-1]|uniref:gamma-glutamylcyclotransferase n=1 Tax=Methylobacterium sp. 17Sr1-1 TaxID=2202826 RepID=UPI000D6FC9EC|nr:gamma-glutamylcyclotransferase [Methylobacterium sp. 17Sr1-1]AWN52668.1 gamma-glutamylcyclotransferase [Methylobacterium sp. 17Sr1-1]
MQAGAPSDLWVFGYGSLMWRPGFPFVRAGRGACAATTARSVLSHVHRGTPERPGLVLGLDRGGSCRGMAFRVAGPEAAGTLAYLREREQVTAVYVERLLGVTLDDGRRIEAVTYLVDRRHPQYAGRLPEAELVRLVRQGLGRSGANPDYVRHTHDQLVAMGIPDPMLARLAAACAVPSP